MPEDHFNVSVQKMISIFFQPCRWTGKPMALLALMVFLIGANRGFGAETSLAEYRVKSVFLLNFSKYVDWPSNTFAGANSPIIIGLIGDDKFAAEFTKTVEGKAVPGRSIIIQTIEKDEDFPKCHILFIADSEKKRLGDILDKIKTLPVLTVGEADQFMQRGGVINFAKREGKVRLEINLNAARQAKLVISARLLSVADVVKGKTN